MRADHIFRRYVLFCATFVLCISASYAEDDFNSSGVWVSRGNAYAETLFETKLTDPTRFDGALLTPSVADKRTASDFDNLHLNSAFLPYGSLSGAVIERPGSDGLIPLASDRPLYVGDVLRKNSSGLIAVSVDESSENFLIIDGATAFTLNSVSPIQLSVDTGVVGASFRQFTYGLTVSIRTPHASIILESENFIVETDDEKTMVAVSGGIARVAALGIHSRPVSEYRILNEGEYIVIRSARTSDEGVNPLNYSALRDIGRFTQFAETLRTKPEVEGSGGVLNNQRLRSGDVRRRASNRKSLSDFDEAKASDRSRFSASYINDSSGKALYY